MFVVHKFLNFETISNDLLYTVILWLQCWFWFHDTLYI